MAKKKPDKYEFKRDKNLDDLAGLPKKEDVVLDIPACFNERVHKIEFPKSGEEPFSVILFDVDYFKALNDLFDYD